MNLSRLLLTPAAIASLLLAAIAPTPLRAAPPIDLNSDGIPDVWALHYNLGALSPTADADGDGQSNGAEAVAGTNPLKPDSTVKITSISQFGAGVQLSFATEQGKRYQLQTSPTLASAVWTNLGTPLTPDQSGTITTTNTSPDAMNVFYRVSVLDIDSDGDGVNDWEEIKLGFDPYNGHTGGLNGPSDYAAITAGLTQPTTVTVSSIDDSATEPSNGGSSTDEGAFVITRTGGFKAMTVFYNTNGSAATAGTDYVALSGSVVMGLGVRSVTIPVVPLEDSAVESPESVVLNLVANAAYTIGSPSQAGLIIEDRSGATGNGVFARYWNNTSTTIPQFTNTVAFGGVPIGPNPALSRIETQINNNWPDPTSAGPTVSSDYFVARYTANVMPEFSQVYTFKALYDRGVRLFVNGQQLFSNFSNSPTANTTSGTTGTIDLQAGKLYPIVLEYMGRSGPASVQLLWASANQPEQVIPQNRLFASAAPIIISALDLYLLKDGPAASYQIVASGEPTSYSAANLPPGWTINTATGAITGPANTAGEWNVMLGATNANGTGSALLSVVVQATGGAISRDVWSPLTGTSVSAIPLTTNPTATGTLPSLEGIQNTADDYGARIRGYITAPVSGVYKFFLTASDAAELYISDDDEPINLFKRAEVTTATNYREWTSPNAGKSPLLQLYVGRRYYVEVRHKAGVGSDHVSVGWMQPGQGGNDPGAYVPASGTNAVVPGFVLSPYVPPTAGGGEETLYYANLTPQAGTTTTGYGSIIVALSADETQATLRINYANLTSAYFGMHLHDDRIPNPPGGLDNVVCDLDQPGDAAPLGSGSWRWTIQPRGPLSAADIVTGIKTGHTYFNVHSVNYPGGEIKGFIKLLEGSQAFVPPAPQTWTDPENAANVDSHLNRNGASRFLIQATFGVSGTDVSPANGNPDDIDKVQSLGFEGWIDDQINNGGLTAHYPYVFANRNQTSPGSPTYSGALLFNSWWKNSIQAPDQLRQRLAFALSEILVTSEAGPLTDRADALSDYYDMLVSNAFTNFKTILVDTTKHPTMGRYLDMLNNDKPDLSTGRIPNENYAREIKQLFSIGLNRLHPDGSLMLNSKGELIPTYDQDVIIGFAHAFTGWSFNSTTVNPYPTSFSGSSYLLPMTPRPARHFTGQKRTLNNVVLPGLALMTTGQPLDPYAAHSTTEINAPAYQALPEAELDATHEQLFRHPNTGPFICRQLIQRFVSGTPSRGYLYRVVQKFENNGSGVRGDMKAVIKAILLDYEARSSVAAAQQGFGKQREPVVRVTGVARAFPAPPNVTGTYTQVGSRIDVATTAPHLYASGQSVDLDFGAATSGDVGQPLDATHTTLSTPAVTATTFSVRVKSFEPDIEYTQANGITTFHDNDSTTNDLSFAPGDSVAIEYVDGTPVVPTSGIDTVEYRSGDQYTVIFANPTTKRGTYSQAANSSTMTVTITAHGYTAASTIHLEAVSGSPLPAITTYTINTVTANTFTVTTSDTPTAARSGTIFATPPADLVASTSGNANLCRAAEFANRVGPVEVTYSDWNMGSTNTDLNQTPMQSPTVFNFYLPDYQHPGILSNAGLITPEFELTSETSVIRQSNTLYNGIFFDSLSQSGLSSFKSGGRDVMVDLRPWMGAGPGGLPWAHDNNLNALLDELSTRLMAGKLSSTGTNNYASNPRVIVNAKDAIRNYIVTLPYDRVVSATATTTLTNVTVAAHGFTTGTVVAIAGVTGTGFTNGSYTITVTGPNTFTIPVACTNGTPGLGSATATPAGGSAKAITGLNGFATVTVTAAHGLTAGATVTISGVTGGTFAPSINGTFTLQTVPSSTTFVVPVTRVSSTGVSYSSARASTPNGFTDSVRDRIRSVVHLLITSPDYTIQK